MQKALSAQKLWEQPQLLLNAIARLAQWNLQTAPDYDSGYEYRIILVESSWGSAAELIHAPCMNKLRRMSRLLNDPKGKSRTTSQL